MHAHFFTQYMLIIYKYIDGYFKCLLFLLHQKYADITRDHRVYMAGMDNSMPLLKVAQKSTDLPRHL